MANSASLLLPGSNLTNLIVLAREHVSGATFAARLAPAWAVAVPVTIAFVSLAFGGALAHRDGPAPERPPFKRASLVLLLLGVLGVAVALGTLARAADVGHLAVHAGRWETAWIGAGAAVVVNNLPAAVVLSAHLPAHPRALLLGLDIGPNLAATGSLSAVLWYQVARAEGARPSLLPYTLYGIVLAPLTIVAALLVTST